MRVLFLLPLTAAVLLVACGKTAPPPPDVNAVARERAAAQQAADANLPAITGQLTLTGISKLPPNGFELELRLLDATNPNEKPTIVTEVKAPAPQLLPAKYRLPYHAEQIDPTHLYVVEAALNASGARVYGTAVPTPILTEDNGNTAMLELVRGGMTATNMSQADLTKASYKTLAGQLGGMRLIKGKSVEGETSVGWDAFLEDNVLRMAREQVNLSNEETVSYRYAYQAGKPWVVEREMDGVTSMAGWDNDGHVILNEQSNGSELSDDAMAALMSRAEARASEVDKKL